VLRLRFDDFSRSTTSHALARPTDNTAIVLDVARRLLARRISEIRDRGCTLVGITLSGLDQHGAQLMLPLEPTDDGRVDAVIDSVRDRFGTAAIGPASLRRSGRSAQPARGLAQVP
jgi:DNA polymerase IV